VGSAIVNQIAKFGKTPELLPAVTRFTQSLIEAVKKA
jgi:hypothetical protein